MSFEYKDFLFMSASPGMKEITLRHLNKFFHNGNEVKPTWFQKIRKDLGETRMNRKDLVMCQNCETEVENFKCKKMEARDSN